MATYTYTAKSQPHKIIQGQIQAESEQDAVNKVTRMGYFPLSVSSESYLSVKQKQYAKKFSAKVRLLFTSQLSSLIESGVNIVSALNIIHNQPGNRYLKVILADVTERIKDGQSLSASLAAHPDLFPAVYSAMVGAGEASGNLKYVLQRLADFYRKEEDFRESLRATLTYPVFVLGVGALTVAVLLIFVIPRLVAMFEDMGQALPLPTLMLIKGSDFLRHYWWFIFAVFFIFIFLLRRLIGHPQGRMLWDTVKLNLAVSGQVILKTEVSRLMRTLSLLLSSGIAITPALRISEGVVGYSVLKSQTQALEERIKDGSSLSGAMRVSGFFGDFAINVVHIGEEGGSLEKSLERIADNYEKEVDTALKKLMRLLEPLIILFMGMVVGFIVLAMLLPIFQINLIAR
jgi:type II secretory pathway component PulF